MSLTNLQLYMCQGEQYKSVYSPSSDVLFFYFLLSKLLYHVGIPKFIKFPHDQTGISGGVASFICQATGDPKPLITWMKKGKKVNSQRFEV